MILEYYHACSRANHWFWWLGGVAVYNFCTEHVRTTHQYAPVIWIYQPLKWLHCFLHITSQCRKKIICDVTMGHTLGVISNKNAPLLVPWSSNNLHDTYTFKMRTQGWIVFTLVQLTLRCFRTSGWLSRYHASLGKIPRYRNHTGLTHSLCKLLVALQWISFVSLHLIGCALYTHLWKNDQGIGLKPGGCIQFGGFMDTINPCYP